MLAHWLDRDGLGQILAPDETAAKEPIPDERNSWFWRFVAPDPNFQGVRAPPQEAFMSTSESSDTAVTENTDRAPAATLQRQLLASPSSATVICQHCGKETAGSPGASTPTGVPSQKSFRDHSEAPVGAPPSTPIGLLQTPSPVGPFVTFAEEHRQQRSFKSDSALLADLVLSAAKETARSMHSPPNQVEHRDRVFRICGSTNKLNDKMVKRLRKLLEKDPTLLAARSTHLGLLAPDGYTCLMVAANAGNVVAAKTILEAAAKTDSTAMASAVYMDRDLQGRTALHIAAEVGNVEIVDLIQQGHSNPTGSAPIAASPGPLAAPPVDLLGRTPLGRAMTSPNPKARKRQKELEKMLFSPGDVSIRGIPEPAMQRAAMPYYNILRMMYGMADMPGMRVTMEDAICAVSWEQDAVLADGSATSKTPFTLLGVCDGHGDHGQVSKFVADTIPVVLKETIANYQQQLDDIGDNSSDDSAWDWEMIWVRTCKITDEQLKAKSLKGGSTAVLALITENVIVVANVGDSRCILVQQEEQQRSAPESTGLEDALDQLKLSAESEATGSDPEKMQAEEGSDGYPSAIDTDSPQKVNPSDKDSEEAADDDASLTAEKSTAGSNPIITPLSFDHKPDLENEKARIIMAGLDVVQVDFVDEQGKELTFHKVKRSEQDQLAVSRAFGDFEYKGNATLGVEEQAVIPVPDIQVHKRNTKMDMYLVLACDGVWDVMSNEDVGLYVSHQVDARAEMSDSAAALLPEVGDTLLSKCLGQGSRDNMSIVLVALDQAAEQLSSQVSIPAKTLDFS